MPLYSCQPPTGYADTAEAWVNTGALVSRMNFALALTANRVRGVRVDAAGARTAAARCAAAQRCRASTLHGDRSPTKASRSPDTQIAALMLGSPEFQAGRCR